MEELGIHIKLRLIREAEGCGRDAFSKMTSIPKRTIENYENKGTDLRTSYLVKLCDVIPEYALWLLTNEINISVGQISPEIKTIWNKHTLDMYDKEDFIAYGISTDDWDPIDRDHADGIVTKLKFDRFNEIHLEILNKIMDEYKDQITDAKYTSTDTT